MMEQPKPVPMVKRSVNAALKVPAPVSPIEQLIALVDSKLDLIAQAVRPNVRVNPQDKDKGRKVYPRVAG
jgi:hypothetical protein